MNGGTWNQKWRMMNMCGCPLVPFTPPPTRGTEPLTHDIFGLPWYFAESERVPSLNTNEFLTNLGTPANVEARVFSFQSIQKTNGVRPDKHTSSNCHIIQYLNPLLTCSGQWIHYPKIRWVLLPHINQPQFINRGGVPGSSGESNHF